jgi:hypothetical protein
VRSIRWWARLYEGESTLTSGFAGSGYVQLRFILGYFTQAENKNASRRSISRRFSRSSHEDARSGTTETLQIAWRRQRPAIPPRTSTAAVHTHDLRPGSQDSGPSDVFFIRRRKHEPETKGFRLGTVLAGRLFAAQLRARCGGSSGRRRGARLRTVDARARR